MSTMRPARLIGAAWHVVGAQPFTSGALGLAVVLSMASMLFGIGLLATPWFVCEIWALQLAATRGTPVRRTWAWLGAGGLVVCTVGVVAAATWLAGLSVGPDVATIDAAPLAMPWPEAVGRAGLVAAVTALTVGFIAPFVYAPLILIERGGNVPSAILESVWLVAKGGLVRHWALVFTAHLLPLAPAIVAAVAVARTFDRAVTPIGVLLGLPVLPLSIPLGLGLVTASYAEQRSQLSDRRWTRVEARPPLALTLFIAAIIVAQMASVALLVVGATRPSELRTEGGHGERILSVELGAHPPPIYVPDTTLEVRLTDRTLEVVASDGDGTGRLRLPEHLERLRVLRDGDVYAIELLRGAEVWSIDVDRAGVRTDDTVHERLWRRIPLWGLPAIAASFTLSAICFPWALAPIGAIRRAYARPGAVLSELRSKRERALGRSWILASILIAPALLALAVGMLAVWGG